MGPNQMYKLLHSKETISKAKRQPMDWEKIFRTMHLTRDEFPNYTNNSHNSISKKQKQTSQKVDRSPK